MTGDRLPPTRRDELEAWWAFAARVLAFFLGGTILTHEMLAVGSRVYLIVAGVGLCGPVVAQSVATVFASIRGGGGESD
jgi:hypothetical protein